MTFDLHPSRWVAILAAFALFFIVLSGKIRYTTGDSRYSLLASQALLEHGNLRLDPYNDRFGLWEWNDGNLWQIFKDPETKHTYYNYPIGTPIFATPFVAVGRAVGFVPMNKHDDSNMQMLIASTTLIFIFFLLFRLALLYLDDWPALIFSLFIVFGTCITSTLGTALWSQNFETIFICLALLELATVARGKRPEIRGGWLGAWLFAAYLCRPTAAPFIVVVFVYLIWKHRKALPWTAGVAGAFMLWFAIWSYFEFGTLLPRYYSPASWPVHGDYLHTLWPVLFGPARGLFSFMPIFVLMFVGFGIGKLRREPLFWAMWAWLVLLTVVVVRAKNPWGGWCYGPRFYTEIIPGLAWILMMILEASGEWKLNWRRLFGSAILVTSLVGVYIHTWQGLYVQATQDWNGVPNIDTHWNIMRWDWRFPQFLATNQQISRHNREIMLSGMVMDVMAKIPPGGAVLFDKPDPEVKEFYDYWNVKDRLHTGKKVYNTVIDLKLDGVKEFWYSANLYRPLLNNPELKVDFPEPDSILDKDSVLVRDLKALGHAQFIDAK